MTRRGSCGDSMFSDVYRDKKVLITGHSGFKGSWLTCWLLSMGARVVGVSMGIPTSPSMYSRISEAGSVKDHWFDITNTQQTIDIIQDEKPDFIFHLAAQPIVSVSYKQPIETIKANIIGTANVLEALRVTGSNAVTILITSDKSYENIEQIWGYKETDRLGGKDIYSGSKGGAELIINAYVCSFFSNDSSGARLAVGRAGNVIGGGDWAPDRLVVDAVRSWSEGVPISVRSPSSTRPWQHVLEPLSGYLTLGQMLSKDSTLHGEAFNFGPDSNQVHTVEQVLDTLAKGWGFDSLKEAYNVTGNSQFQEAGLLKLDCDKAKTFLNWTSTLTYDETMKFTADWYKIYYDGREDLLAYTLDQIDRYCNLAVERGQPWTV